MQAAPLFHRSGDPTGDFFALAYVSGRYVSATGSTNVPAFFVLYFSASEGFAPLSYMATSMETGEVLLYSRGDEAVPTVEFALLCAAEQESIPAGLWRLFPRDAVDVGMFADATIEARYWETRRRLCLVLYPQRAMAQAAVVAGKAEPLFRAELTAPHLGDGQLDNDEIFAAAMQAHAATGRDKNGDD